MKGRRIARLLVAAALAVLGATGCDWQQRHGTEAYTFGDPQRGGKLIQAYGCGACHVIPGVASAGGTVGPPLVAWSRRTYVAGMLPNVPEQLMRWIMTPQAIVPGNAMPDMGVSRKDAADIAAYLYTIR